MINMVEDLEILTTIPASTLKKLMTKEVYCIANAVEESMLSNEDISEVDIGIGTLYIKHVDNEIKYKFVPSAKLNDAVKSTVVNKKNVLVDVLEPSLVNNFKTVYKDLC